jgi:hypothetical protein
LALEDFADLLQSAGADARALDSRFKEVILDP